MAISIAKIESIVKFPLHSYTVEATAGEKKDGRQGDNSCLASFFIAFYRGLTGGHF